MKLQRLGSLSGPVGGEAFLGIQFRLPDDHRAWANFSIAALGGGLLVLRERGLDGAGLALLLSMASLVLVSEWISNLMGRSSQGPMAPARLDPRGLLVAGSCLVLLLTFLVGLAPSERQPWLAVLAAVAAAVGLLFLLRLEWVAMDRRLLLLTQLLLTTPCLLLGFRAWGVGAPEAFAAWAPLALFLPGLTLVERVWMDGPTAAPNCLTFALLPTLSGMAGLAAIGQAWMAVYFACFSLRAALLLLARRSGGRAAMPSFRCIRAFGRESALWTLGFVLLWLGESVIP